MGRTCRCGDYPPPGRAVAVRRDRPPLNEAYRGSGLHGDAGEAINNLHSVGTGGEERQDGAAGPLSAAMRRAAAATSASAAAVAHSTPAEPTPAASAPTVLGMTT